MQSLHRFSILLDAVHTVNPFQCGMYCTTTELLKFYINITSKCAAQCDP